MLSKATFRAFCRQLNQSNPPVQKLSLSLQLMFACRSSTVSSRMSYLLDTKFDRDRAPPSTQVSNSKIVGSRLYPNRQTHPASVAEFKSLTSFSVATKWQPSRHCFPPFLHRCHPICVLSIYL